MSLRALLVFFVSLCYVRIAGIRTLGSGGTFDKVTTLMFGTLMGNAIFNSDVPFFPLLLAALVVMLLHRLVAYITCRYHRLGHFLKGAPIVLAKDGALEKKNMNRSLITENDIRESMRINAEQDDLQAIELCILERNGSISFVKTKQTGE
jgi:uncharacterized membrane protein YcaP (DUF421 family)